MFLGVLLMVLIGIHMKSVTSTFFPFVFGDSLFASIEMKCTFEAEVRSSLSRHMCDKD